MAHHCRTQIRCSRLRSPTSGSSAHGAAAKECVGRRGPAGRASTRASGRVDQEARPISRWLPRARPHLIAPPLDLRLTPESSASYQRWGREVVALHELMASLRRHAEDGRHVRDVTALDGGEDLRSVSHPSSLLGSRAERSGAGPVGASHPRRRRRSAWARAGSPRVRAAWIGEESESDPSTGCLFLTIGMSVLDD